MSDSDPYDWPKTLQVGGREYELTPEMSMTKITEIEATFTNEAEKLALLMFALFGDDIEDDLAEMLPFDPDDPPMEEHR